MARRFGGCGCGWRSAPGLVSAALGAAAPHAHPILAGITPANHCEPVVRDQ